MGLGGAWSIADVGRQVPPDALQRATVARPHQPRDAALAQGVGRMCVQHTRTQQTASLPQGCVGRCEGAGVDPFPSTPIRRKPLWPAQVTAAGAHSLSYFPFDVLAVGSPYSSTRKKEDTRSAVLTTQPLPSPFGRSPPARFGLGGPKRISLNLDRILQPTRHRRCRWRSGTATAVCRWTTSGDRKRSSCCSQGRQGWARLPWLMWWPSTAGTAFRLPAHPHQLRVVTDTHTPSVLCGDRRFRNSARCRYNLVEINASDDRSGAALCEKIAEAVEFQDVRNERPPVRLADVPSSSV